MTRDEENRLPKLPGVYKWTNKINGKIYIGKSVNIYDRVGGYRRTLKKKKNLMAINYAHKKYGLENFSFEVLEVYPERNEFIEKYILIREAFWISFYDSYRNGYNNTLFSNDRTGIKASLEVRARMSAAQKGIKKPQTMEHRRKHSETLKGLYAGEKCSWFGKSHSAETKLKMSLFNHNRGKKMRLQTREALLLANSKLFCQVDINTGEIVQIFKSISEAVSFVKEKHNKKVLRPGFISLGFLWILKDEYDKLSILEVKQIIDNFQMKTKGGPKRITQFNIDGSIVKIWDSISEICRVICGKSKHDLNLIKAIAANTTWKNFYWKFDLTVQNDISLSTNKIDQIDLLTGEIIKTWPSMSEAARCLNITPCAIGNCIRGKVKTCVGFSWKRS